MPADPYAGLARWYDMTASRALASVHARFAVRCAAGGFRRVLDIGCGTGRLASLLHGAGIAVTGVDRSAAMLARASAAPFPLLAVDSLPFPFAPQSFDLTLLSLVLHESADEPEALLAEALRLAPLCLVLEWRMPERNLDLPLQPLVHAVERLAGARHYARFRAFARRGYLHGAAMRAQARVCAEEPCMAGTMVMAEVRST